jgi:hypothetical protein
LYVGRMCGTRKGWSKAGQKRFNELMVQVFIDRKHNGDAFDNMMRCRMREAYGKKRPLSLQNHDNDNLTGAVVVYSDLNLEYMIRQANLQSVDAECTIAVDGTRVQEQEDDGSYQI